jgi:DNA replication and repair protein RecF
MLERLTLTQYRNYGHEVLDLAPGVNLIVGPNAQGKTNLLEAIYLLSTGKILRGMKDQEAIMDRHEEFLVVGMIQPGSTEIKVSVAKGHHKKAFLNEVKLARTADLLGRLPSVIFSNLDLEIVRGDASNRRLFLDLELSQIYPGYLKALAGYKRALEQRNALCKAQEGRLSPYGLSEIWDQQLAEFGTKLREYRKAFTYDLNETGLEIQEELAGGEKFELTYLQKEEADNLAQALQDNWSQDVRRGTTSVGPHRDDVLIQVENREVRLFGSQGQQRTAGISLKLATMRQVLKKLGIPPIVLLDDVLSELDESRRRHLLEWLESVQAQTVLTCTEAEQAGKKIMGNSRIFGVQCGTVKLIQ